MKLPTHLKVALWAVGGALILFTLGDLWLAVRPLEPGQVAWRFNALTVLSSGMVTPLLGVLCLLGATAEASKRWRQLSAGVLTLVALFLFVAAGSLVLDTVQLRQTVTEELRGQYDLNSARALFKLGFAGAVLFIISGALLWTERNPPRQRRAPVLAARRPGAEAEAEAEQARVAV